MNNAIRRSGLEDRGNEKESKDQRTQYVPQEYGGLSRRVLDQRLSAIIS